MGETLEESIQEDKVEELAVERQFARKARKVDLFRLSLGLGLGLAVLISGMVLVTYEGLGSWEYLTLGFLFFPIGLWILASVALGGLGPGRSYRFFGWWDWMSSEEAEEYEKQENEKAKNIEERRKRQGEK